MSGKDKWVRLFTVDETAKHKNGFTIYKITSTVFLIDSPEALTVVSVWKRYSDVQRLHKAMRSLHAGLYLQGVFPTLNKWSYFKRFDKEVIEDRAKSIKNLLEFIAGHRLLFASTDFVNFLKSGHDPPDSVSTSTIAAIRSSLQLPAESTPPIEYQTDEDDSCSVARDRTGNKTSNVNTSNAITDNQFYDVAISQIPICEPFDVEIRQSPKKEEKLTDSFESLNSLESLNSDFYEELSKMTIDKEKTRQKSVLPDLINFDAPSTSKFDDYHTMSKSRNDSETTSLNSTIYDSSICFETESKRSSSRISLYSKRSALSYSDMQCKTRTEDSYVFEAGYLLNLAARCEDMGEYQKAFDCYKSGIEKMLVGVQSDPDQSRRALIKEKTHKYLSYAEDIHRNHLSGADRNKQTKSQVAHQPIQPSTRSTDELSRLRPVASLNGKLVLALRDDQNCCVLKVIQKIPNNLIEFDELFGKRPSDTKKPILPANIPYMVQLHSYVETSNLVFLILSYAPGEKLFDYIKRYAKSLPTTPARDINLENVFIEPKKRKEIDNNNPKNDNFVPKNEKVPKNENTNSKDEVDCPLRNEHDNNASVNRNETDNLGISVNELVINSQRLLKNVDKALSGVPKSFEVLGNGDEIRPIDDDDDDDEVIKRNVMVEEDRGSNFVLSAASVMSSSPKDILPPSALTRWGAEILTAIEGLHSCGVICRDLNPENILLGDKGHVTLTYFIGYEGQDVILSMVEKRSKPGETNMYIAPELYNYTFLEQDRSDDSVYLDRVCDYWSFGAIMYELLCGFPLSRHHRSVFTSHTLLHLPESLDIEEQSLLNQLLTFEPSERLGAGKEGIMEIKSHPYFKNIDWREIYENWSNPD